MVKLTALYDGGTPKCVRVFLWVHAIGWLLAGLCKLGGEQTLFALLALAVSAFVSYLCCVSKPHEVEIAVQEGQICISHPRPWGRCRVRRVCYEVSDVLNFASTCYRPSMFSGFESQDGGVVCLRRGLRHIKLFENTRSRAECARVVAFLREQCALADHTCFAPPPGA